MKKLSSLNFLFFIYFLFLSNLKILSADLAVENEASQEIELSEIQINHDDQEEILDRASTPSDEYIDEPEENITFIDILKKWYANPNSLDEDESYRLFNFLYKTLKSQRGHIHKGQNSTTKNIFKIFVALTLTNIAMCTGVSTIIHEYIGHLKLGGRLIYEGPQYTSKEGVDYEVFVYQQMKEIKNFKDFIYWFFHVKRPHGNIAGFAKVGSGRTGYTELGKALGPEQASAWISMSGPITYAIANLAVLGLFFFITY